MCLALPITNSDGRKKQHGGCSGIFNNFKTSMYRCKATEGIILFQENPLISLSMFLTSQALCLKHFIVTSYCILFKARIVLEQCIFCIQRCESDIKLLGGRQKGGYFPKCQDIPLNQTIKRYPFYAKSSACFNTFWLDLCYE